MQQNVKLMPLLLNLDHWISDAFAYLNKNRVKMVFFAIYALVSLYGMSYYIQNSMLGDAYPYTRYEAMMNGYARKPFIYRQFVPFVSNAIAVATPQQWEAKVNNSMETFKRDPAYRKMRSYMPWLGRGFPDPGRHFNRLVTCAIDYACLVGYMVMLYRLGRKLFETQPAIAYFAPIFGILAFSSYSYQWYYIYDLPCLFLSAACFYYLLVERYRALIFAFLLAVINKETAIFILIFYGIWAFRYLPTEKFVGLGGLLALIFITVKTWISYHFIHNDGFFLENNFAIVYGRDTLGQSNNFKLVLVSLLFLLFTYRWQEKPLFLKLGLCLFPLMYLGYVYHGYAFEYRVFFDIHPPLVLLMTHTLIAGTGISQSPIFNKAGA
jgi:hypothetical protein